MNKKLRSTGLYGSNSKRSCCVALIKRVSSASLTTLLHMRKLCEPLIWSERRGTFADTYFSFYVSSTVHHSIELFHQPTLKHSFLYSLIICLLHCYPRHVSSINMPIFRRKNCIHTASGIFALCKRLHRTLVIVNE